ncbi:MAG: hypothetical protein PHS53_02800 [Candidatus Pacebacteria bacterium]|nr:hypothetical protein [Candidatus Paceibacterota bacterium]MDD5357053.1 hypothetical protein [Candidatus Paceibacterota bacterium]
MLYLVGYTDFFFDQSNYVVADYRAKPTVTPIPTPTPIVLDFVDYDKRMAILANNGSYVVSTSSASSTKATPTSSATSTKNNNGSPTPKVVPKLWPVKTAPYPKGGAILPFKRIVAYYGNFYAKGMGVLGEYPPLVMLQKLNDEIKKWEIADPYTPVMPAIDYIAVTAQGSAGADGKYRARMPSSQMDYALGLAKKINGIVILEIQVGLSTIQAEVPLLEKYLKMPEFHLAIDPEFAMAPSGKRPGTVVGTVDATDINWAANYLAKLVKENNLPPKVLIVHRYTQAMVTNYKNIKPLPEVQILVDMDGWGSPTRKLGTYQAYEYLNPVQFTGFKLFYKNDLWAPSPRMMTPAEILKLQPRPSFIQYQ